jgi:hypothetical protein
MTGDHKIIGDGKLPSQPAPPPLPPAANRQGTPLKGGGLVLLTLGSATAWTITTALGGFVMWTAYSWVWVAVAWSAVAWINGKTS